MQRKIPLLASVAVVCLSYASAANAGPMGHFAGPSAGVFIGWAHVMGQIDDVNPNYANNSGFQDVKSTDGYLLGGHLGYDWQFDGSWLAGLETSVAEVTTDTNGCDAAGCRDGGEGGQPNLAYQMKSIFKLRARVGFLIMPDSLLYGAAGFALAGVQTLHHDNSEGDGTTRIFDGYTLAAGVQHTLSEHADVRFEVSYDHFGSKHWTDNFGETFGAEPTDITVSLGAVWHLD